MINVPFSSVLDYLSGYGIFEVTDSKSFKKHITISEVTVLEIESPDLDWLKGDELILSTLTMCKSDQDLISIIHNLHDGNAASLGIHNALNKASLLNNEVISLADELELPIIIIPATISYGQVISRLYTNPDKDLSTEEFYFDILSNKNNEHLRTIAFRNNILINGLHAVCKVVLSTEFDVNIRTAYLPILQRLSYRIQIKYGILSFVAYSNDSFIFFIHFNNTNSEIASQKFSKLAEDIMDELSSIPAITCTDILKGTIVDDLFKLSDSFSSSEKTARIINRLNRHNGIYSKEYLEAYYFFDIQDLDNFRVSCKSEIETMKEKLGPHCNDLMDTLECFYETNCSVSKTAQKMYLHPNTIKYRLKVIRSALGDRVLDEGNYVLLCHFLLKQRRLL